LGYLFVTSLPPAPLWVNDQGQKRDNVGKEFDGKVIGLITSVMTLGVHRTTKARWQRIEIGRQQRVYEGAEADRGYSKWVKTGDRDPAFTGDGS
jgi:hypothetical protein